MTTTTLNSDVTAASAGRTLLRSVVIGIIAFLTVVDLFATQAILPSLALAYQVSPAAMGFAVNASTIGMAFAGLAVALLSRRIDRRRGIYHQPCPALHPHRAARGGAGPHDLHDCCALPRASSWPLPSR